MRKGMFTFFGGLVLSALLSFGAMAQQAAAELPAARKLTEQIRALSPVGAVRGDR